MRDITKKIVDEIIKKQLAKINKDRAEIFNGLSNKELQMKMEEALAKYIGETFKNSEIKPENIACDFFTAGQINENSSLKIYDKTNAKILNTIKLDNDLENSVSNDLYSAAFDFRSDRDRSMASSKELKDKNELLTHVSEANHKNKLLEKVENLVNNFYTKKEVISEEITSTQVVEERKDLNNIMKEASIAAAAGMTFENWILKLDGFVNKYIASSKNEIKQFFDNAKKIAESKINLTKKDLEVVHADMDDLDKKQTNQVEEVNSIKVEGKENNEKIKNSGRKRDAFFKFIKEKTPLNKVVSKVKDFYTKITEPSIEELINIDVDNLDSLLEESKNVEEDLLNIDTSDLGDIVSKKVEFDENLINFDINNLNNILEESKIIEEDLPTLDAADLNNILEESKTVKEELPTLDVADLNSTLEESKKVEENSIINEEPKIVSKFSENIDSIINNLEEQKNNKLLEQQQRANTEEAYRALFDVVESPEYNEYAKNYQTKHQLETKIDENTIAHDMIVGQINELKNDFRNSKNELLASYGAIDELDLESPEALKRLSTLKRKYTIMTKPLKLQLSNLNKEAIENEYVDFILQEESKQQNAQYELEQEQKAREFLSGMDFYSEERAKTL